MPDVYRAEMHSIQAAITNLDTVRDRNGDISTSSLASLLRTAAAPETDSMTIPLYIRAQNTGLLLTKLGSHLQVYAFAIHPTNEAIVGTMGRLRRQFPSSVVEIDVDKFRDPDFVASFVDTVSTMSRQEIPHMRPNVASSEEASVESRDVLNAAAVTDFLVSMLAVFRKPKPFEPIVKHMRDEIMYDNALLPFRRSGLYTLLRVTAEIMFAKSTDKHPIDGSLYKPLML
jgi:hypothetical protein